MLTFVSSVQREQYSYNVKVMNPEKAKDFKLFTWHDVHEKFLDPSELKEKLREDFGKHIPESDFDVGFLRVDQLLRQTKNGSFLLMISDLNEDAPVSKRAKKQAAIDDVKKELLEKHAGKYSEPQYKLWALMIVNGQWSNKDNPFHSLGVKNLVSQGKKKDENTIEVLAGAAIQVIDYFKKQSSSQETSMQQHQAPKSGDMVGISPAKKAQIRSQYLQQLRELQKLRDEGTINDSEFAEEKERVLHTLRSMH